MIATDLSVDYVESKMRLADLKIQDADLLREVAEIEKDLAAKEGERVKLQRQIEQLTTSIYERGGYTQTSHAGHNGLTNRVAQLVLPGGSRISAPVITGAAPLKKTHGRPKREDIENAGGSASQEPLPSMIEKMLRESKDGLTLSEMLTKIRESNYVTLSLKPRSMLDQAIFRLKKKGVIVRNDETMKYVLVTATA